MTSSSVARRYARALMSIGVEDGRFEQYAEELLRLVQAFEASPELRDLWLNPASDRAHRMAAIDQLAGPLQLSKEVTNVVRLLVERQRVQDLPTVAKAYQQLVDEKVGRLRAVVTTAAPVSQDIKDHLGKALVALTKKQIVMETRVDPKLIGGVVAQVGGTIIDGSLRTQLEQLRESMKTAPL